jgi:hypothetical protein
VHGQIWLFDYVPLWRRRLSDPAPMRHLRTLGTASGGGPRTGDDAATGTVSAGLRTVTLPRAQVRGRRRCFDELRRWPDS